MTLTLFGEDVKDPGNAQGEAEDGGARLCLLTSALPRSVPRARDDKERANLVFYGGSHILIKSNLSGRRSLLHIVNRFGDIGKALGSNEP